MRQALIVILTSVLVVLSAGGARADDPERATIKADDFSLKSPEEMIESFSGALNIIIGFVVLIALISVIVSAINTAIGTLATHEKH